MYMVRISLKAIAAMHSISEGLDDLSEPRNSGTLSIPARREPLPYRMAGIDVHKKRLAVVVADFEQLRVLSEWLIEQQGRGSGDGIDRAILEACLGSAG
jgi:hypothetical protein